MRRPLDTLEHAVEPPQDPMRGGPVDAGVVRDLVVSEEGGVDGGHAQVDVPHDRIDGEELQVHVRHRAHEEVAEVRMDPRPPVRHPRLELHGDLEQGLPDEQDQHAGNVVRVAEEPEELVTAMSDAGDFAGGQQGVARVAGEEVAATRTVGMEQPVAAGELCLELRHVLQRRAAHHAAPLPVPPAECDDALVVAEQDACLARAGLRGQVRLPGREPVAAPREPGREVRHPARLERGAEDRLRETVDLEEEHARYVGLQGLALATGGAPDDSPVVCVVGAVEDRGEHDLHEREHERHQDTVPEVDGDAGKDRAAEQRDAAVQHEREQTEGEEGERKREPQRQRPEHGVEYRHHRNHRDARAQVGDREPVEHGGERDEHRCLNGPEDGREQGAPHPPRRRTHARHRPQHRADLPGCTSSRRGDAALSGSEPCVSR